MKFKRIIAAFMAAVVCGSAAVTAGAEELKSFTPESYNAAGMPDPDTYYDGAGYLANGGDTLIFMQVVELGDSSVSKENELIIPEMIDGKYVTQFYPDDTEPQRVIEKIFIPSSLKGIYSDLLQNYHMHAVPFALYPSIKDVYFGGNEEQWYEIQESQQRLTPTGLVEVKWDGKFSKNSNYAYDGIENITLHVNCKDINDEGTIVNFDGSSSTEAKTTKPAKVSGIKKSCSKTYIKLSWNESKNAESYVIMYSTDKKVWKTKTVKASSVRLTKLKAGTKYYIKIAAKNSVGTSAYSKVFSVTTKK